MCRIPTPGYYYRTRCVTCRKYFVSRRPHARTCSSACRKRRQRENIPDPGKFVEYLGYFKAGQVISGKLGENTSALGGSERDGSS
jgi:hypothetical protein